MLYCCAYSAITLCLYAILLCKQCAITVVVKHFCNHSVAMYVIARSLVHGVAPRALSAATPSVAIAVAA
jgi:hypothetical protein